MKGPGPAEKSEDEETWYQEFSLGFAKMFELRRGQQKKKPKKIQWTRKENPSRENGAEEEQCWCVLRYSNDYHESCVADGCRRGRVKTAEKEIILKFSCEWGEMWTVAERGQERGSSFGWISELPGHACTLTETSTPSPCRVGTAGAAHSCLFLAPFFLLLMSLKRRKGHNSLSSQEKAR